MANNKFTYEISQSITSSVVKPTDTIEFSFQGMVSSTRAKFYSDQTVNFYYSASTGWEELPNSDSLSLPKKFVMGTAYSKKSFVFSPPEETPGIKAVISGSVGIGQGVGTDSAQGVRPSFNIDYDDFKFNLETPKVELTDGGLLVYTSPSRYIRANSTGLDILGGDINVDKVTANELEIFGNISVFGDLQASSIPADDTTTSIVTEVSTSISAGESGKFARADHIHSLEFSVLDDVAQEGHFTQISSSIISGSTLNIKGDAFISGTLEVIDLVTTTITSSTIVLTGSNQFGDTSSQDHHYFTGSIHASGSYHEFYGSSITMSAADSVQVQDTMYVTGDKVGIGTVSPNKILDVSGSVKIFGETDTHLFISGADSANIILRASASTAYETYGMSSTGNKFKINRLDNAGTSTTSTPFTIDNDRVGIGTTSPAQTLTVQGDTYDNIGLLNGSTLMGLITLQGSDMALRAQNSNDIVFYTNNTEIVNINHSGNVGIGTTSPGNLLHLYESGSNDYQLKIYQTGSDSNPGKGSAGIFFSANNDYGQDGYIRMNDSGFFFGTTDNEDIIFTPGDNEVLRLGDDSGTNIADVYFHGTTSPTLFVSESGNVGIGTKTPSQKLTVAGNISASGDLHLSTGNDIVFYNDTTFVPGSVNTSKIQWDFNGDDAYIYAHQSSSDVMSMVFEMSNNTTSDHCAFWFNDWQGSSSDAFPLYMDGGRFVVNHFYDKRITYGRDNNAVNGSSNNVDFYLLKSGSTSISSINSLIFGDVSDDIVTINGKVGIGTTTTPTHTLEVKGAESTLARFYDSSNGSIGQIEIGTMDIEVDNNVMKFRDAADTDWVTLSGSKVGIGTAPSDKLHIKGSTVWDGSDASTLRFENSSATNKDFLLNHTTTGQFQIGEASGNTRLLFNHGGAAYITNGNLGVGMPNPAHQLDINGSVRISSSLATLYLESSGDSHTHGRVVIDTSVSNRGGGVYWRDTNAIKQWYSGVSYGATGQKFQIGYHSGSESSTTENAAAIECAIVTVKTDINESGVGYVGIGTTNPSATLHITSSTDSNVLIEDPNGSSLLTLKRTDTDKSFSISLEGSDLRFIPNTTDGTSNVLIGVNSNSDKIDSRLGVGKALPQYELDVSGSIHGSGKLIIDEIGIGTTTPDYKLDVIGNAAFKDSVGTSSFASGFGGYGWRIGNTGEAGASGSEGWGLSVDNLTVRGQMKIYELLIQQLRATNGSVWISSTGKVDTVVEDSPATFSLQFDTGSNVYGHGFVEGDLIRAQRFQGGASEDVVTRSDLIVTSVGNSGSLTTVTSSTGNTPPSGGFDYVRIGNTTSQSRQGAVYLTSDDDEAPYIDIIDGVSAHADFNADNNIKARLGKLDGISSTVWGDLGATPNNYGLYSDNVYLEGGIRASFGEIGGFGISSTALSSSDNTFILSSSDVSMKLGTNADTMTFANGTGIFMSGSGDFRVGSPTDSTIGQLKFTTTSGLELTASYINLKGSGVEIETENFELNSSGLDISAFSRSIDLGEGKLILSGSTVPVIKIDGGQISASHFFVSETGEITASAGKIAGWVIDTSSLSNGNVTLDSVDEQITLGSGILLSGSGEGYVANQSMSWDSSGNLQITASKVDISGSDVNILTPNFFFGSDDSYISGSSTGLVMSSSEFNLNATGLSIDSATSKITLDAITLHGATGEPYISLSDKLRLSVDSNNARIYTTAKSSFTDSDAGFYLASENGNIKVNIGDNTSAIKFNSTDSSLQITSSNVNLSGSDINIITENLTASGSNVEILTPSFMLGDLGTSFISSSTDIEISASSFHLKNGNMTASNVDLSGTLTSTAGNIGGWDLSDGKLDGGSLELWSVSSSVLVTALTSESADYGIMIASLGQTWANGSFTGNTGLSVVRHNITGGTSKPLIQVDEATQSIAGWDFDFDSIYNDKLSLNAPSQSLFLKDVLDRQVVKVGSGSLSQVTGDGENLFSNSGFESGIEGWFSSSTHTSGDRFSYPSGIISGRDISVTVSTGTGTSNSNSFRIAVSSGTSNAGN